MAEPLAPTSAQVDPEHPWLGLRSFDEGTRGYFFGRDAELRDLAERVRHRPLTVLFGQSGLGKTSLLRAGLVPQLREAGFVPIVLRLDYGENDPLPGEQILHALRTALGLGDEPAGPDLDSAARLWLLLHDPALDLLDGHPEFRAPLLLFDQFEEIFTLGTRRPGAAGDLRAALAVLAENRPPESLDARLAADEALALRIRYEAQPARVVLSLREDFLHLLERWKRAVPAVMENRLELRLLTGPQALQAVVEPGKLRCRGDESATPIISEATGAAIVRFVAAVAPDVPLSEIDAVPPLLSLLCAELNAQRRSPADVIRPEQLRGRAEDILGKFYDRCLAPHPPAVRVFIEDRLLSADGFRESTAAATACYEFERAGLSAAGAEAALTRLVDDRLLVAEERGGVRRIEFTHDILTGIARRSRDERREREATAERRRARNRLVGWTLALALLVAGIAVPLSVWALREKTAALREKARAMDRETAARQAEAQIAARNRDLQGLLEEAARSDRLVAAEKLGRGLEGEAFAHYARAVRYTPRSPVTAETALPLIVGTKVRHPRAIMAGHTEWVTSAVFSPDGRRVLTASDDNTARLWPLLPSHQPPPDWFGDYLIWIGGLRIGDDGHPVPLTVADRQTIAQSLHAHADEDSDYARLLRWSLAPAAERTVDPYGTATRVQWAAQIIQRGGDKAAMDYAYALDPYHPLIHLALAAFEKPPTNEDQTAAQAKAAAGDAEQRAGFLRDYSLSRLPADPALLSTAATMLGKQKDHGRALATADRALGLDARNLPCLRVRARALEALQRNDEALAAYQAILVAGGQEVSDFTVPGYLAARLTRAAAVDLYFRAGQQAHSLSEELARMEGWARLNLGSFPAAVAAFRRAESLQKPGEKPSEDRLGGLALALWLNGERDAAIAGYGKLIEANAKWAKAETITGQKWPEAESKPMEALRAETLRRHPELAPKAGQ